LQRVLLATIPATGIFLVKDLLLEIIITRQASKMYDAKKDLIFRQAKANSLIMNMFAEADGSSRKRMVQLWFKNKKFRFYFNKRGVFLKGSRSM
jgi:hypothetical protein